MTGAHTNSHAWVTTGFRTSSTPNLTINASHKDSQTRTASVATWSNRFARRGSCSKYALNLSIYPRPDARCFSQGFILAETRTFLPKNLCVQIHADANCRCQFSTVSPPCTPPRALTACALAPANPTAPSPRNSEIGPISWDRPGLRLQAMPFCHYSSTFRNFFVHRYSKGYPYHSAAKLCRRSCDQHRNCLMICPCSR